MCLSKITSVTSKQFVYIFQIENNNSNKGADAGKLGSKCGFFGQLQISLLKILE